MIRVHRLSYECTLCVLERCETATNQSQDACLEHFRSISPLNFEFRKNILCSLQFFSQKSYGDVQAGLFREQANLYPSFFAWAATPFFYLKTDVSTPIDLVLPESNQRCRQCRKWEAYFDFQFKTKKLDIDLPWEVTDFLELAKKNNSGGNWSLHKMIFDVADFVAKCIFRPCAKLASIIHPTEDTIAGFSPYRVPNPIDVVCGY